VCGTPKSDVITSRSPEAKPKSGPDYSVFITSFFFMVKWSEFQTTDAEVAGSLPGATRFSEK
jgi:hypothetical protein